MSKSPALVLAWLLIGLVFTATPSGARHPLLPTTITPNTLRANAIDEYVKGNTDSALDIYEQAADLASRQYGGNSYYVGDLYYEMGSIALQGAKFQRAEAYLTQAVKIRPNSVTARARLVDLLLLRGRKDEAREHAKQAVIKHPDSLEAR
ncbi:MAG TPA: tetratricopeptide repeat protein, partial [Candidatus Obscuribacterales bacterium]